MSFNTLWSEDAEGDVGDVAAVLDDALDVVTGGVEAVPIYLDAHTVVAGRFRQGEGGALHLGAVVASVVVVLAVPAFAVVGGVEGIEGIGYDVTFGNQGHIVFLYIELTVVVLVDIDITVHPYSVFIGFAVGVVHDDIDGASRLCLIDFGGKVVIDKSGVNGKVLLAGILLLNLDATQLAVCVRHLLVGGEALVPVTPPEGFKLINIYGPTECTVCITTKHVDRLYRRVPIGKALDNIKLYVVDKNMKRLPAGVPGELCAAGPQVSRGYLNLPEKTGVIYVKNPFDHEPGYELMYRTGDIVRLLPDGMIDFIGRNDGQVKVRGFRIELSEVEEVIRHFDGIRDATVAAFDAPGGGKELAAYVVSDQTVDIQTLKEFIRGEKPAYMVPAVIMQIDRIPLNQNQKVNRRALPKPEMTSSGADHASAGAPLNRLEEKLQELISELLGGSRPGLTETLSSYGFSSLSAIRLATLIYKQYGVQLAVKSLAASGTIQSIENEILMYLRRNSKTKSEVSIDEPLNVDWEGNELLLSDILGTESDIITKGIEEEVDRELLNNAMEKLSGRERKIVEMRFGILPETEEKTQKEVADILGISQSYISRLEKKIMRRLKKEMSKLM